MASKAATSKSPATSSKSSMRLKIRGIEVTFPCKPYPSQFSLMDKLIAGCKNATHGLLESPTGSGKSLALLCSALAWQRHATEQWRQREAANQEALAQICFCRCHFAKDKSEDDKKDVEVENSKSVDTVYGRKNDDADANSKQSDAKSSECVQHEGDETSGLPTCGQHQQAGRVTFRRAPQFLR